MKIPFTYYLHDHYSRSEFQEVIIESQLDIHDDPNEKDWGVYVPSVEDLMQNIGSPFYEVTLECELDTETGEVTVQTVKL